MSFKDAKAFGGPSVNNVELTIRAQVRSALIPFELLGAGLLLIAILACASIGMNFPAELIWQFVLVFLGIMVVIPLALSRNNLYLFLGHGFAYGAMLSYGFRLLIQQQPNSAFWAMPICALLCCAGAIISYNFWCHLIYNLMCWAIITQGSADTGYAYQKPLVWLTVVSCLGVASAMCFFIERARRSNVVLLDRLEVAANFDGLTKIRNRASFLRLSEEIVANSLRHNPHGLYFVLIDVDNFKRINDSFGHAVGDRVLQQLANVLQTVGESGLCGRLGGEEFGVLFHGIGLQQVCDHLKGLHEQARSIHEGETHFSISSGVSGWLENDNLTEMMYRADMALYAAKTSGKDRWCVSPELQGAPRG